MEWARAQRVSRWRFLTAVSAVQLAFLLYHLGSQSLWLDEVTSFDVARGSWGGMVAFFRSLPEQHPFYYLLLRAWLVSFGTSDAALRLLSVLPAVAGVWALFFLVERLRDRQTAAVAAVLMAFAPYWLYYGQEGRMYALLGFLTVFNAYWFLVFLDEGSRGARTTYVISAMCGVYTHLLFWFALFAQLVFVALRDWPRRGALLRVAKVQALVALAYLPWAALLVTRRPEAQSWKGAAHVLFGLPYTLLRFSLGYSEVLANAGWKATVPQLLAGNAALLAIALPCFGALAVVGGWQLWRARPQGWFVWCGLAVPMAAALLASPVVILVGERYLMVSFPFYVTLLAAGFMGMFRAGRRGRAAGAVVAALYVLVISRALADYYFNPAFGKEQWREVAQFVHAHEERTDVIVVHAGFVLSAFARYYGTGDHPRVRPSTDVDLATLRDADRVWLVLAHTEPDDIYGSLLVGSHQIVIDRLFPHESGIRVLCLERRKHLSA